MARLPQPGGDSGNWGTLLNDFLRQIHTTDGTLKDDTVGSAQLQDNSVTAGAIAPGAVTKTTVGLTNVNNTADIDKPVSTAQQAALDAKADAAALATKLNTADLDVQTAGKISTNGTATQAALNATFVARKGITTPGPFGLSLLNKTLQTASGYRMIGEASGGIAWYAAPANSRIVQQDVADGPVSGSARTLPTDVAWSGVSAIVKSGSKVLLLGSDGTSRKVWQATHRARSVDWDDWTPVLTLKSGALGYPTALTASEWATGPNIVVVAEYGDPTGGPAIYVSTDNGATWTKVWEITDSSVRHVHAVEWDPYNPGHIWTTAGDGVAATVLRSTDYGTTWVVMGGAKWQAVQISFSADHVWFACDSRQASVAVYDRAAGAFKVAAKNYHYYIPPPTTMGGRRSVSDAMTTVNSTTMTSATAAFVPNDRGRLVIASSVLPPGTFIATVVSSTQVTLSANAVATSAAANITIGPDQYYANAFNGAIDPETGVYYCVAGDTSSAGNVQGLFYLPELGDRLEILDPGGYVLNSAGLNLGLELNGRVFVKEGYVYYGQYRRPLLSRADVGLT